MCDLGSRSRDDRQISDSDLAIEILDKRYALGEINKEEYEEKNRILKQVPAT